MSEEFSSLWKFRMPRCFVSRGAGAFRHETERLFQYPLISIDAGSREPKCCAYEEEGSMLKIALIVLLCALGLSLIVGCSKEEKSLKKYANATLTARTGLGDLLLGTTTLDGFIRNIGKGRFSLAMGDEPAFEFAFNGEQIAFQFLVRGACDKELAVSRDLRSAAMDLEAFVEKHPGCRGLALSSISVAKGSWLTGTFYKGATEKGAKLGAPITTTVDHGPASQAVARMVAGLSPTNPEEVIEYPGILFYYVPGSSGKMEDTVIQRITVFGSEK